MLTDEYTMKKKDRILDEVRAPRPDDYMPEAIQKAVVQKGIKHPATVYPIALGISSAVVGLLFETPALMAAALGLGLFGPLWAVSTIFFRHESIGSQYLDKLHQRQKKYEQQMLRQIAQDLKECRRIAELKEPATQGLEQLNSIQNKLANVKELLDMKLKPNEITYGRFLGAAEQVSLGVLDSLRTLAGLLKSSASIQPGYIQKRIAQIESKTSLSKEDQSQLKALQERMDLWTSQLEKANRFMARNEEAMTELERVSAAVAQWNTERKFSSSDLENTITRLHELAAQAHEYSR